MQAGSQISIVSDLVTQQRAKGAAWAAFVDIAQYLRDRKHDEVFVEVDIRDDGIHVYREDRRAPILIGSIRTEFLNGEILHVYRGTRNNGVGDVEWITTQIEADLQVSYGEAPRGWSLWRFVAVIIACALAMFGLVKLLG